LSERIGIEYGENYDLKISEITSTLSMAQIILFVEKFSDVKNKLKDAYIIQLPFELALAEICMTPANTSDSIPIPTQKTETESAVNIKKKINSVEEKQEVESTKTSNINLSDSDIKLKWKEVLVRIKKHNHSLSFILRVSEPRELSNGKLILAFKYKFHKDRVSDEQIKLLVNKVVGEVFGFNISIEPIIDESMNVNSNSLVSEEEGGSPSSLQPNLQQEESAEEGGVTEDAETEGSGDDNKMINSLLNTFGGKVVK
jgi:flagellar hook-basal body complex protein FliE